MSSRLFIVIPCFNEEEMLGISAARLKEKMTELIKDEIISADSRILFVDDGSTDETWNIIRMPAKRTGFSAESDFLITEVIRMHLWQV